MSSFNSSNVSELGMLRSRSHGLYSASYAQLLRYSAGAYSGAGKEIMTGGVKRSPPAPAEPRTSGIWLTQACSIFTLAEGGGGQVGGGPSWVVGRRRGFLGGGGGDSDEDIVSDYADQHDVEE